jgi:hypothetical protein
MNKPALLIIDMLNDSFRNKGLNAKRNELCDSINQLLSFAREKQFHIIWVRQEFKADLSDAFLEMRDENIKMYIEGTFGSEIVEELRKSEDEFEIIKKRYSAFFQTGLNDLLKRLNPSFLVSEHPPLTLINLITGFKSSAIASPRLTRGITTFRWNIWKGFQKSSNSINLKKNSTQSRENY